MLDVKALLNKLLLAVKVDYIVEQGTKGTWHYRKWKSGKVEAWTSYSFASASWSVWVSPVRYMDKTINIPSGIFTSTPTLIASSANNQYWVASIGATSATAGSLRLATVASTSMATYVRIYAWQN